MRGFTLLGKEFAEIIKSKKILIPIIAVLFVPLLYAGMFLWAFWDPYDQLDDLPVAIVNLDESVVYNGKPIEAGKKLVDNLKEKEGFKWEFVSEKTAEKGMDDRKYYMTIRIPNDFSKNTTTLLDANPKKSKLEYIPNESLNFLSSQIGGSAIEKIKSEVSASVTKTYAETMFDSLKDVSKGFADGSEGAGKIHDGTGELKDGSGKVTDGLNTLNSKTGEMQTGVGKLLDGSQQIEDGLGKSATGSQQITGGLGQFVDPKGEFQSGLGQLSGGSKQLADGLVQFQEGQGKLAGGAKEIQKGINDLHGGLEKSSAGVQEMQKKLPELTKGTEGLSTGASELAQGATKWQQKANELSGVAEKTAKGTQGVEDGLVALNEQIKNLPDGEAKQKLQATVQQLEADSKDVAAGTKQVSQGVKGLAGKTDEIQGGATKLAGGANAIHAGQVALQNGVDQLQNGQQQLVAGAGKLAEGQQSFVTNFQVFGGKLGEASKGASDLNSGLNQLSSKATAGLGQLYAGSNQLTGGLGQLYTGSNQLTGGLGELSSGSKQMADGVNQLADGSGKVTEGLGKVNDGSKELATKLGEGAEKTSETKGDENKYDMFASPVKVETEKVTEVPNYGTGFTPYFLSLGLFVGALLLSIVFPLRETVGIPKSGFSWFISKFGVLLAVGVIQALVADAVLLLGLGVEVQSIPYFILFSIITSLSFIALVQFLVTAFSDAGRFIAILTLILQLTTSAGTFPLELIPKPLQIFNAWFPMTYSVSGFKAVISSGDYSYMWQNVGILMIFIVLLSLGTIGTLTWMHKRQFRNLVEEK
ncbi:YhgE/Pip family protein [Bacillus cereus]|uniref:YhgE/Pip family protein n=1 Tax=Bacillus cereus TaxID=1396 RepID=UPI0039810429